MLLLIIDYGKVRDHIWLQLYLYDNNNSQLEKLGKYNKNFSIFRKKEIKSTWVWNIRK